MSVEYAPRGLVGVLTPQANTTVEPELAILMPPGVAWINGRLTSPKTSIEARLVDYFDRFDPAVAQFANAPVGAIGFACTGTSYLVGAEAEDARLAGLSARLGVPVVTAATAVCDGLRALGARRIALVSPYPASLTEASARYWAARGFEVVETHSAWRSSDAFHPIYSLPSGAARAALDRVSVAGVDAVLLLGTGMPTLRPIRDVGAVGGAPVLSCMLCIGWRLAAAVGAAALDGGGLRDWVAAAHWGARLPDVAGAASVD